LEQLVKTHGCGNLSETRSSVVGVIALAGAVSTRAEPVALNGNGIA
jgi:hypothetical protein